MVLLILCVFDWGVCVLMYICACLCPANCHRLCIYCVLSECMQLQSLIHGIMSCGAGRCQGIWLRGNCPTVVISVFLVGIMLKTKNDWNDSDLPAWSTELPLTTAWKYRLQQLSEKCYGFTLLWLCVCVCGGEAMKKGLTQSLASRITPGEIST